VEPFQAWFLSDDTKLVLYGAEPGRPARLFVLDLPRGTPRPLLPEGWTGGVPTPDGRFVTARGPGDSLTVLQPLDGGQAKAIPGITASDVILEFSQDGEAAFVAETRRRSVRLDLRTGRRSPWLYLSPPEPTGVVWHSDPTGIVWLWTSVHSSGRYYSYSYERLLSSLYMIEGLK
jgi:hypothetical protein